MAPALVVFDLDGTLVDSREAILRAYERTCADLGLPWPGDAAIEEMVGLPLVQMVQTHQPGADYPAFLAAYRAHYFPLDREHTRPFSGIAELLAHLVGRGVRLAVASSKMRAGIERVLGEHGLHAHFEVLVGVDDVSRPKPHPESLEKILGLTGVSAGDAVMVGDSEVDLRMAAAAGLRGVGVGWGVHTPERLRPHGPVAEHPAHLLELILG